MKRTNLVLMISAALTLAACGGNSSNDSAPSDPTPPKTAQPTPKPTPTPETSEQEAEKPEAKKPATGGSSGSSGGSGGSYGGSSGSTGGAGGDTGGGDETGDSDKTDDGDEDKGGEETVKELTDEQIQAFANSGDNSFVKGEDLKKGKAVKVGDKWNGYYLKSDKTEENPNPAEVVLMPTAESNTEAVKTTIKTAKVRKWGDIETATTRITPTVTGVDSTGTDYLSKAYSYSRFGIKVDGEIENGAIKSEGKEVTYYSVGDIGSLIPNASEPPAHGEAKYLGVAFLNATVNDSLVNTIGTFEGHAKFSKKEFEGSISGLRTYETLALLAEGNTKKMTEAVKKKFYGDAEGAKKIKFTAEIKGHHLVNDGSADPGIKVDGAFYGPEAAEVGGMISKENAFDGVFGGEKIKDAAPAE